MTHRKRISCFIYTPRLLKIFGKDNFEKLEIAESIRTTQDWKST